MSTMYVESYSYPSSDTLYHYGVPGMRWGVRKKYESEATSSARRKMQAAKANKHQARVDKQTQNAAFNKAYEQGTKLKNQFGKARRKAYNDAIANTAEAARKSNKAYKQAKKDYKNAKRDYKEKRTIDRYKKHGLDYNIDTKANVHNHGFKGAKRIEDRIANKSMSRLKSESIETGRTATKAALISLGTMAVIGAAATVAGGPKYQVLDASGKVIRNFYR